MAQYQQYPPINWRKYRHIILIVTIVIFLLVFGNRMFIILQPAEKGVIFYKFGNGLDAKNVYGEGFNIIAPWNEMIIYNVQEQQIEETMDILSSNGLSIAVDVSVRFTPIYQDIGLLYKAFQKNHINSLAIPELRSAVRRIIGRYTPEELYSTKREEIEHLIYKEIMEIYKKNHIQLKALLIRSVQLPVAIQAAIENKLKQEQSSLEYEFRLQKETKEAERKRIEAKGIKDFQDIVSEGISDKLLKWKGIEATLELAKSQNSKVVIVGNKDGLPIILGDK